VEERFLLKALVVVTVIPDRFAMWRVANWAALPKDVRKAFIGIMHEQSLRPTARIDVWKSYAFRTDMKKIIAAFSASHGANEESPFDVRGGDDVARMLVAPHVQEATAPPRASAEVEETFAGYLQSLGFTDAEPAPRPIGCEEAEA
jgi:hypothetical protein